MTEHKGLLLCFLHSGPTQGMCSKEDVPFWCKEVEITVAQLALKGSGLGGIIRKHRKYVSAPPQPISIPVYLRTT